MDYTYKDPESLKKFVTEQGTILPRSKTGLPKKEQNKLAREIERARHLALIKYTQTL
jgi:small subunit ribosomal protein S18